MALWGLQAEEKGGKASVESVDSLQCDRLRERRERREFVRAHTSSLAGLFVPCEMFPMRS